MIVWVLIFTVIAWVLYQLLHVNFPPNVHFSRGVKISAIMVNAFEKLGNWSSKVGFNKWNTLRFKPPIIPIPDGIKRENKTIGGVPVIFLYPNDYISRPSKQPVVIFYHGGGWTVGRAETYVRMSLHFVQSLDMMVVIPDYRLAPEHPFPIPYQDCLDCTTGLLSQAEDYNIDRDKVILSGDSAGGNLCVAIALVIPVRMVASLYPSLQCSDMRLPSYLVNAKQAILTSKLMGKFFLSYMGLDHEPALLRPFLNNEHTNTFEDKQMEMISRRVDRNLLHLNETGARPRPFVLSQGEKDAIKQYRDRMQKMLTDARMAPLVANDQQLMNLPTTHVVTCQYDVLRDDGVMLVERLKLLGKKVSHQHMKSGLHGWFGLGIRLKEEDILKEVERFYEVIRNELS